MEKHNPSLQVSQDDWDNTPPDVKRLVSSQLANAALSENESYLIQFLDATPVGIAVHDVTGKLIYINNIGRSLLGTDRYSESETNRLSESFQIYRAGTQIPYTVEDLPSTRALAGETSQVSDLEVHRPDRIIPLEVTAIPVFDDQGQVTFSIATFQDISDRKRNEAERDQAETALKESELKLRNLTDAIPSAVYQFRLSIEGEGSMVFISQGIRELGEILPEQATSDIQAVRDLIFPEDLESLHQSIMISAQTLTPWHLEFRIHTASGKNKWISGQSIPYPQENGEIIWNGILTDISDRKSQEIEHQQVEEALKQSETRFRNITESLPGAIFRYLLRPDNSDAVLYMNQRCYTLWEVEAEAVTTDATILWQMTDPEDLPAMYESVMESAKTLQTWSWAWRITTPSGRKKWLEAVGSPERQANGDIIWDTLILDISDRKQAELALIESEERYRLLAENINDLVCLHHLDGRYLYVSPSCEALLGYGCSEMIGQEPYTFFHPDDRDRVRLESHEAAIAGNPVPITYRMRQKSGDYIWLETLTKPITDDMGKVIKLQTTSRNITERIQVQTKLKYEALHDSLTGLPNRHLLIERLELAIRRVKRFENYHFAVLFLDLDRFKVVNDSLGHLAGDKLLIAIAQKLKAAFREIDLVARLGGDEFVILLEEIENIQESIHAAKRIFTELQSPTIVEERNVYTTASIGIVLGTKDYEEASHLLRDADIAMYRAKTRGKDRYEIFDAEMHTQALARMHLENDLRRAIDCEEFVIHYQPIVSLTTGYIIGFEALIRWQDPNHGLKYPLEFISVTEEMGLITSLSYWALRTAMQQLVKWQTTYPHLINLKISVNLSAQDLKRSDLVTEIDRILTQTHLQAKCLTLEITESMLIEDIESTIVILTQLREKGIQISIDDFGTGYSSLSYLHRLPIDNLKIDHSFVNQIQEGNENNQIIETIATLGKHLKLGMIAEGIETLQQLKHLQKLGYQFGQGYLFSKPLSQDLVEEILANTNLYLFS